MSATAVERPLVLPGSAAVLNARERRVCTLIVAGYSNRQIAELMLAGLRTVEAARTTAAKKLRLPGAHLLIVWAAQHIAELPALEESLADDDEQEPHAGNGLRRRDPEPEQIADLAAWLKDHPIGNGHRHTPADFGAILRKAVANV